MGFCWEKPVYNHGILKLFIFISRQDQKTMLKLRNVAKKVNKYKTTKILMMAKSEKMFLFWIKRGSKICFLQVKKERNLNTIIFLDLE